MKPYHLPNGLAIYQRNDYETDFVFNEIFVDEIYLQHGIKLNNNATVFDVGANIGLFSLYIKQHFPDSTVYAFEPAPEIFQLLQLNTLAFGGGVNCYNCALGEAEQESLFYYYPDFSVISGFYADKERDANIIMSGLRASETQLAASAAAQIKARLAKLISVRSKVMTLSSIINQTQLNNIDLLKMDVEGSEWPILKGINSQDFNKIQQIVMEVHCQADLSAILSLLNVQGYEVTVEPDKRLKQANIYNLFAIKKK